jgi:hypothetical protein
MRRAESRIRVKASLARRHLGLSDGPAKLLTAVTVLFASGLSGLALPSPARADEVATAQARVDALQQLARDTTLKLTDGTRRWEADQADLGLLRLKLGNTRRHIVQAQAQLDEQQRKVTQIARQLYVDPLPSSLQMFLTRGPAQVMGALQAQQSLNMSAGSQSVIIARAQTARHRLRNQEQTAQSLVDDAAALTKTSAKRLAELNALADRTAAQLTDAQNALSSALTARAEAQARVARAARAADVKAARERAARSRLVFGGGGGAACSGKSTDGQANGNLDPGSLCPLWMAPGQRLRADAATAFNKMSKYHASTVGSPLCVTDSYRSYSQQVELYHRKPGLAAVPGTSEHGWGKAVDFCGGIENTGSSAYNWMKANAGRFGWIHPDWAEPSGSRPEPWHWEFNG